MGATPLTKLGRDDAPASDPVFVACSGGFGRVAPIVPFSPNHAVNQPKQDAIPSLKGPSDRRTCATGSGERR